MARRLIAREQKRKFFYDRSCRVGGGEDRGSRAFGDEFKKPG